MENQWQRMIEQHRKEGRRYEPLYREWCVPNKEWQRCKLEALRYKWRYTPESLSLRLMQRLGDFGRKFFPMIAAVRRGEVGRMPR